MNSEQWVLTPFFFPEGTITHLQRVAADKIAGGKAELVRANGDEIRVGNREPVPEAP